MIFQKIIYAIIVIIKKLDIKPVPRSQRVGFMMLRRGFVRSEIELRRTTDCRKETRLSVWVCERDKKKTERERESEGKIRAHHATEFKKKLCLFFTVLLSFYPEWLVMKTWKHSHCISSKVATSVTAQQQLDCSSSLCFFGAKRYALPVTDQINRTWFLYAREIGVISSFQLYPHCACARQSEKRQSPPHVHPCVLWTVGGLCNHFRELIWSLWSAGFKTAYTHTYTHTCTQQLHVCYTYVFIWKNAQRHRDRDNPQFKYE